MAKNDNETEKLYTLHSEHWIEMHSCNGQITPFIHGYYLRAIDNV